MNEKDINMEVNLYEFNRVNMGKLPLLKTKEEIDSAKKVIQTFIQNCDATYYMLLNHDNHYFTLFSFKSEKNETIILTMAQDVIDCLESCGLGVIDINLNETLDALEVWVKDLDKEVVYMYMLFPYDSGVIEYASVEE